LLNKFVRLSAVGTPILVLDELRVVQLTNGTGEEAELLGVVNPAAPTPML
jgi:hypothetical protein